MSQNMSNCQITKEILSDTYGFNHFFQTTEPRTLEINQDMAYWGGAIEVLDPLCYLWILWSGPGEKGIFLVKFKLGTSDGFLRVDKLFIRGDAASSWLLITWRSS